MAKKKENKILNLWLDTDEACEEIFGDLWDLIKSAICIAIIIGLGKLIF